jgi:hypothetical protein
LDATELEISHSEPQPPITPPIKSIDTSQLWDEIGFHKPMAGFWFNIVYTVIGILLSATFMGYFMSYFYPFPESWGYRDIAYQIFGYLFFIFDVATGSVMGRFIPEANIKDPKKMLHYVQWFIWYQMFSGLVQTTIVSLYALAFARTSNISYVVWIMLICSTTQYPGFLGVFSGVLDALQQYHKAQTARFLASTIVQRFMDLGFIWAGKVWGQNNPEIGVILGIAIGSAVGLYVSQFTAMIISAVFFAQVMKSYGIRPRDCFRVEFTWEEVKPVIIYAVKTSVPGIVGGALNQLNLWLWILFVPQYTTVLILSYIGGSIPDTMDWFGVPSITALVSESYMDNKKELTKYYIGQLWRFNAMLQGFFVPLMIVIHFIMPTAWLALGMVYYLGASIFILPRLIKSVILKYMQIPGQVIYGGNRPNYMLIAGLIQSVLNTSLLLLYLIVWQIPKKGILQTALIMEWGILPLDILFGIIAYIYIHKTMVKIQIGFKQIIFGFIAPALISLSILLVIKFFVYDTIYAQYGFFVALVPTIVLSASVLLFLYFPLTGLMGGWDETNLEEFRKVSLMSGPSKFIVIPIYRMVSYFCKKSPLHGRFELPVGLVVQEAKELLEEKRYKREILKEELAK